MSQDTRGRRAGDVSVRGDLLAAAGSLDVDVAAAAEAGIERAIAEARAARWQRDNAEAIDSANRHVEQHGLPLAKHRPF
jgi:antitoxin CcdA